MNDSTELALRQSLQEHGDRISPTPALPGILHRANAASARAWPRWAGLGAAGLATAGLVTGVVLAFGPTTDDGAPVTDDPGRPVDGGTGEAVTVEPGTVVPMALHFGSSFDGGTLASGEFEVTSTSGDVGVDAVSTLLTLEPREPFVNWWTWLDRDPASDPMEVRSVMLSENLITVDFNRFLGVTCPANARCIPHDGKLALQQLVQTMQSVLRSDAPVLLTVAGGPADEAFGVPLDGPIQADPSVAPGIRVSSPGQGATVDSPILVTGDATSHEGTVLWAAERAGEVVQEGFTTGGSMGQFAAFQFSIDLGPGDYTIRLWEDNAAGGSEGLAPRLSPVFVDVTVE